MDKFIKLAFKNKWLIVKAEKCACYYCKTMLEPSEVDYLEEADGKYTAVCPHCGIDSVIDEESVKADGRELNEEFLNELNEYAF
jgi:hypothetical protein